MAAYFIGVDVGTQGVRIVLLDDTGAMWGQEAEEFLLTNQSRQEQSAEEWWQACMRCLKRLTNSLENTINVQAIKSMAVTSTSGTVIPLDAQNRPLHFALMYSDPRQSAEGEHCKGVARKFHPNGYTGFNASSGLSKIVWFAKHFPKQTTRLHTWLHAADYIAGQLSGNFRTTDYTNALKTGYDVNNTYWPAYLFEQFPLKREWMQDVVPSGEPIGILRAELAWQLGLPQLDVVAGMTDGCASQIASGAVRPGDWNTTIGTTLVIKGVTIQELNDPEGRIYSHRHPEGYWMPGGASNIGADWIATQFKDRLAELSQAAAALIPTPYIAYPLSGQGERFPFISAKAHGFAPESLSEAELFTANMEGVAYVERYAYELIEELAGEQVETVYTAGGGSNSKVWLTIRSNVLNRPVNKGSQVSGAVGAAILAASQTHFDSLTKAAQAMTRIEQVVHPSPDLVSIYNERYDAFLNCLRKKEFIP